MQHSPDMSQDQCGKSKWRNPVRSDEETLNVAIRKKPRASSITLCVCLRGLVSALKSKKFAYNNWKEAVQRGGAKTIRGVVL